MHLYFAKVMSKLPLPRLSLGVASSRKNLENEASDRVYFVHCPVSSIPLGEQLEDHPFRNGDATWKDLKGNGERQPGVPKGYTSGKDV